MALSVSSFPAYAASQPALTSLGDTPVALHQEIEYLNTLDVKDVKGFYEANKDYLDNLEVRIEKYANSTTMSKEEAINSVLSGPSATQSRAANSMSDYFSSYTYHKRGGYWTYSMEPKMSTRLLRPVCSNAWDQLKSTYPAIKNNESSLSDQYWCHFEAFIEAGWDIEEGCPDIGFARVVLARCNPCQNAD